MVLQAQDLHLDRLVALKVMLPSVAASASARQRFLREAKAAANLKHDNIVYINHVGEDRGIPFLAMEFLEGEVLADRLKRDAGPLWRRRSVSVERSPRGLPSHTGTA